MLVDFVNIVSYKNIVYCKKIISDKMDFLERLRLFLEPMVKFFIVFHFLHVVCVIITFFI